MEAYLDILIHPWALWTALMAMVLIICFYALFRVWVLAVLVAQHGHFGDGHRGRLRGTTDTRGTVGFPRNRIDLGDDPQVLS